MALSFLIQVKIYVGRLAAVRGKRAVLVSCPSGLLPSLPPSRRTTIQLSTGSTETGVEHRPQLTKHENV